MTRFSLSLEARRRRQMRDMAEGGHLHIRSMCARDGSEIVLCQECLADVIAEIANWVDQQPRRDAGQTAAQYYTAIGGPMREGCDTVIAYLDGCQYAIRQVREAQAFRQGREAVACAT